MRITRHADESIRILAPAKVNLFLEVLAKRPDGYHDIRSLLCPVSLCDEVEFRATDSSTISVDVRLPDAARRTPSDVAWQVPAGRQNLAWRAARAIQRRLGTTRGAEITLKKSIPAAAGLGGGSSDAAAVLVAALVAWAGWDRTVALEVATELGSDIPFFLGDTAQIGIMLAEGRGERCTGVAGRPALELVITHPPIGCSTAEVYRQCTPSESPRRGEEILAACQSGQTQKIGAELFNALQSAASHTTAWIDRQLKLFALCGASHALMSGSGSSCFAILWHAEQENCIRNHASELGLSRVYSARTWYENSIEQQVTRQGG